MKVLELFKGTGSVGKVAEEKGYEVVSVDMDKKWCPDILTDILDWDYKQWYEDTNFTPDFIWGSPPCTTYSPFVWCRPVEKRPRNIHTAEPTNEYGRLHTKILYRTLEIIDYFRGINPDLKFCLENPRGIMRHDNKIKELKRATTLYCFYDDDRRKPTDFFSNYDLNLDKRRSPPKGMKTKRIRDICDMASKYMIPPKLVNEILTQGLS